MLGFGPPAERQARREWWRRQIQRQQQSPLSVAEFCRRHDIKPVTFYSWRRRLQDPSASPTADGPKPTASAAFVPVSLVDAGSTGQLEIELGNACTVRLKGTVDPKLLRIAIRAAGQFDRAKEGAQ